MRPAHVVLVGSCAKQFAEQQGSMALSRAIEDGGPWPVCSLVQRVFRDSESCDMDDAFRALRCMAGLEAWITDNNSLYDSLEGISDREAPEEAPIGYTVGRILRES
jgi:hypothetical protein